MTWSGCRRSCPAMASSTFSKFETLCGLAEAVMFQDTGRVAPAVARKLSLRSFVPIWSAPDWKAPLRSPKPAKTCSVITILHPRLKSVLVRRRIIQPVAFGLLPKRMSGEHLGIKDLADWLSQAIQSGDGS